VKKPKGLVEAELRASRARSVLYQCERDAAQLRLELAPHHIPVISEQLHQALDWINEFAQTARFELARAERALGSLRDRFRDQEIPEGGFFQTRVQSDLGSFGSIVRKSKQRTLRSGRRGRGPTGRAE
jgi:hypothetical protein